MITGRHRQWQPAVACALLVVATLAVYWPVRHFNFVNYDDPHYVTENHQVQHGVSWRGVVWAFQTTHAANWHPATWLSHMLDVQFFGLQPGPHHLVNVLLHIGNTLLLFLLFHSMTGALWRSAFVAALFAWHPLHVESVAWISERKDVLSSFFGLLAIWAYVRYAEKSKVQSPESNVPGSTFNVQRSTFKVRPPTSPSSILHPPCSFFYVLSLFLFALSLMSKPMLVTLPFLLLLLDCWPLNRLQPKAPASRLKTLCPVLREKLPFLGLAAIASGVTFLAQKHGEAVMSLEAIPLGLRTANAVISYARYIGKLLWPSHLANPYLLPEAWPVTEVVLATVLLVAFSAAAVLAARRRPYLAVGWFWFLGSLVPVIGLVQVGEQAMADRYTYLPSVGFFLLVAWLLPDLIRNSRHRCLALGTAGMAAVLACLVLTRIQLGCWKNGETLFRHTLAVTSDNYVAQHELGVALADQHRPAEARSAFTSALKIKPDYSPALSDLAKMLYNEGEFAAAVALLKQVLQSHPNDALAHSNLAIALAHQGKAEEAVSHHRRAIQLKPDSPEALNNLAWLLATHPQAEFRDGAEAVLLAKRACELTAGTNVWMVSTLAAAYAEADRFAEAVATQQRVCDLAAAQGQANRLEAFQRRLGLYRSGLSYHEP